MASNEDEYKAMQQAIEVKMEKVGIDYNEQCSFSGSMAESNLDKLIQELSSDELDQSIEIVKQLQKVLVAADASESGGEFSEIHPDVKPEKESDVVLSEPGKPLSEGLGYDEIDLSIAIIKQLQTSLGNSDETEKQGKFSQNSQEIKEENKFKSALTDSPKCLEEQKSSPQDSSGKYDSKFRCKENKHLDQLSSDLISNVISVFPDLLSSDIENGPKTISCDDITSSSVNQQNTDKMLNLSPLEGSLNNNKTSVVRKPSRIDEKADCPDESVKSKNLTRQMRIRQGNRFFDCKTSEDYCTESSNLKVKMTIRTVERAFECKICGSTFTHSGSLKQHIRIHTGERPFECKICGGRFNDSGRLKRHIRIHTGERPFSCKICGSKFIRSGGLKTHMRMHSGERPFECKGCGAKFTRSAGLKQHIRIHTGERPFECKICGSKFNDSGNFKAHLRMHTGERPFECKSCGSKFTQSGGLKRHMRIHSGERPFECKICGNFFKTSSHLKKHIKIDKR